ncbi:MAG: hypothetical protein OXF43_11720 [Gammaproteobacteria bacterium]|nr:hypothetical protein [Gammaproteobacteria bacterium]
MIPKFEEEFEAGFEQGLEKSFTPMLLPPVLVWVPAPRVFRSADIRAGRAALGRWSSRRTASRPLENGRCHRGKGFISDTPLKLISIRPIVQPLTLF